MITPEIRKQYSVTIGIECHVQLKTKTKLFSGADNDAREAPPNTLVNHIDFGLPGALPVLNREAVRLASKAAFALGSRPQPFSKFDRKHYFYPDLPMGYQITQFDQPIVLGGSVAIDVNGETKTVGITRAHLESDAGKSTHPTGKDYSLVDLNRAGTPLLEIVSEPDMHSAAEAKAYAKELYLRMKYADVSEANLYYGNMRFDVNVSVSKTVELGTRSETKNLNSFKSVEKAVEYEVTRQIELLEKGEKVVQETRGWHDDKQKTFSQRSKEDAHDYRYMPDPDLPPVVLDEAYIAEVEQSMPALPDDWRGLLNGMGINGASAEALLERNGEYNLDYLGRIKEGATKNKDLAIFIAKYISNDYFKITDDITIQTDGADPVSPYLPTAEQFEEVLDMLQANELSSTSAKILLFNLYSAFVNERTNSMRSLATKLNLIQESDEGAINDIVSKVLSDNAKAADDVKNGEMKAIGFLVGQVMKESKGKANPALAQQLIKKQLEI